MAKLSDRLRELRKKHKLTQKDIANYLGITESGYGYYEQGRNEPSIETLRKLAQKYNVSITYLTGEEKETPKTSLPSLTSKDERDIAKKLENILGDLDSDTGLAFDGEPMDDTTRELVRAQIESNLRLAKQLAKKKFTPKKYRKDDSE
ncbi:helix-turn-helix domain-containing protein [Aneurinibacillus aneurinilyticus]|uniref:helix-turn-helix domain-containing protein n=1 Tax=Aneurinibacillus aneurinilyticus TaxID=1391 RepID=UPI002E24202E|nr:helix-turn-helix domain-containing protein [Aneurinibacillus aneurinilyticus]